MEKFCIGFYVHAPSTVLLPSSTPAAFFNLFVSSTIFRFWFSGKIFDSLICAFSLSAKYTLCRSVAGRKKNLWRDMSDVKSNKKSVVCQSWWLENFIDRRQTSERMSEWIKYIQCYDSLQFLGFLSFCHCRGHGRRWRQPDSWTTTEITNEN